MIIVKLTINEVRAAALHAVVRRVEKINGQRYQEYRVKADDYPWDNEIEGCCGEIALAKHFGIPWTGLSEVGAPDTPWGDTRWTRHLDTGYLPIYPDRDPEDRRFVLVDGVAPCMRLIGWLYAREAKEQGEWNPKYGYWEVPRAHLRDSFEDS